MYIVFIVSLNDTVLASTADRLISDNLNLCYYWSETFSDWLQSYSVRQTSYTTLYVLIVCNTLLTRGFMLILYQNLRFSL